MKTDNAHKWEFLPHFRSKGFGWSGSALACQRIKKALSEIYAVAKRDPALGAEGGIRLVERLYPALQQVDSSSGALGTATNRAVEAVVELVRDAPVDAPTRDRWLDRLWTAKEQDGIGYLDNLPDRWGELCASPERASGWADKLMPMVREDFTSTEHRSYFFGSTACLSCLLAAGRYQELLDLIDLARFVWWNYRQFGVRAIVAMGRTDEAIEYALASRGRNDSEVQIDRACEEMLIGAGRDEEAYRRFGLTSHLASTNLATFRAVRKRYPHKDPRALLMDLIELSPGEEGKWFATAKELKQFDLALDLAEKSPCDPRTLNRAARDNVAKNPVFALGVAMASLHWLSRGYGYEITSGDVLDAFKYATQSAMALGETDQITEKIKHMVHADREADPFFQKALRSHVPAV